MNEVMILFNVGQISDETYYDEYLKSRYQVARINAQDVKKYLSHNLKCKKINYNTFNISDIESSKYSWAKKDDVNDNPPKEIYEYQNFFLLKREDGEYILLDGFRRLLWYNAPDTIINIRIYEEIELDSVKIMKLLVYLNHFKFYGGGGNYFDRGYSLAMKTIFDISIPKIYVVFDSYLTKSKARKSYSSESVESSKKLSLVKDRMTNPMFIKDMKFIESLVDTGVMLNDIFGALLYQIRGENPDTEFDSKLFLEKVNSSKLILGLQEKFWKHPNSSGSREQSYVNQLVDLYENIFTVMFGGEVEKTYTELNDESKKLVTQLKKDKSLIKLTGNSKDWLIEQLLLRRVKNNEPIKWKCVVYPNEDSEFDWNRKDDDVKIEPGLLKHEIVFLGSTQHLLKVSRWYGFMYGKHKYQFSHNYASYGTGKKYTRLECNSLGVRNYKVDVFVDVTKEEIEEVDNNRKNWID